MVGHLTTKKFVTPDGKRERRGRISGLRIKYHEDRPPTRAQETRLQGGLDAAKAALKACYPKLAKARRPGRFGSEEDHTTQVLSRYFKIDPRADGRKRDIEMIRHRVAVLSFNILSGWMYLLDVDGDHRPVDEGDDSWAGTEGYVSGDFKVPLFYKSKAIHISFKCALTYSRLALARVIIHEATHRYLGTEDHAYIYETAKWDSMTKRQAIDNADSIAYAVLSLTTGRILDEVTVNQTPSF